MRDSDGKRQKGGRIIILFPRNCADSVDMGGGKLNSETMPSLGSKDDVHMIGVEQRWAAARLCEKGATDVNDGAFCKDVVPCSSGRPDVNKPKRLHRSRH